MDSPSTSKPALADLDRLLPLLWESLEAGAADAHDYFERHGEDVNRTLYPSIVRYRAIQTLESAGVHAVEFERSNIANNGIEIRHKGYSLRVLKAQAGDVPRAGTSARKRNFYHQGALFPTTSEANVTNLVVLWDYDRRGITELVLACPLAAESETTGVKVAWSLPIPHPAETTTVLPGAEDEEENEDLPITYRTAAETSENAG